MMPSYNPGSSYHDPEITRILSRCAEPQQHVGVSVLLILAWIAHSDGDFDQSERQFLYACGEQNGVNQFTSEIEAICANRDSRSLLYALELLTESLMFEGKRQLLMISCSIAVADGKIAFSENHYLRLISDLCGFSYAELDVIFREVTGRKFPSPQRLHSTEWWEKLKRQKRGSQFKESTQGMSWSKALGILGFDQDPGPENLKQAYLNLVKANHPDRFQQAGPEAMAAANERIKDINLAYEYLTK
jgi:DnaJ-domain-containing protein 1